MKPRHRCYHDATLRRRLREWFAQPLGRSLLVAEQTLLQEILPNLFGYHALQVGSLGQDVNLLSGSQMPHQVIVDADYGFQAGLAGLYARPDALPVESDSIAALILPHTLEFEEDPHEVLREAGRTVFPEGHVVVLGFNPWSLWGMWRLLLRGRRDVPWCGQFLSQSRLKDWLALLGFETVYVREFFFRPPLRHEGVMRKLNFIEAAGARLWPYWGGVYVLVAKKKVVRLTPIRPRWQPKRRLVPGRLIEPTHRSAHRERK